MIDLVGFGIVLPILPLWAETFGASPVQIGLITASYAVMQLLFAPVWGRLSDRYGRRPIILVSLAGSALSALLIGVAGTLLVVFLARLLQGIAGASYAAAQAYVADVTTERERARGMGMIGAAFGLGFVLGPAIGADLLRRRRAPAVLRGRGPGGRQLADRLPAPARVAAPRSGRRARAALRPRAPGARRAATWRRSCGSRSSRPSRSSAWSPRSPSSASARFDYDAVQMGFLFTYIGVLAAFGQGVPRRDGWSPAGARSG